MTIKIAKNILAFSFVCFAIIGCSLDNNGAQKYAPLKPVAQVDIQRYLGTWYEIARYPNRFERGCEFVTARYSLIDDNSRNKGNIRVLNTCIKDNNINNPKIARGIAEPLSNSNNAVLAVNFAPFPLPKGDGNYHIIYLDNNYQNAVVGEPSRKYLWLLSRNKTINDFDKARMLDAAKDNGYDIAKLEYVKQ